ncbi:MAG: hypothetical protein GC192_16700 [Bacteroidetes bacterium]|nr:hypothetical protein [Bacteroidota bacterium]
MARQKGLIKYVGTIGDVRHFKIKGEKGYFAGLVGGPTAEQVKTGDEFKRTRENMAEFAGCAKVGKAIRTAFSPLKHMFSRRLTGTLTAIVKRINLEDGSEVRGQRAILLTQVPQHLEGLDFDPALSLTSVLRSPFDVVEAAGRKGSTLVVPKFNPQNSLKVPSGASHFRLVNAVAAISDFALSAETGSYEPKEADQNGVTGTAFTNYLDVMKETDEINLEATFLNGMEPKPEVAVLNAVGVEFYQKVGDNFYMFASGNAMQLVDVF